MNREHEDLQHVWPVNFVLAALLLSIGLVANGCGSKPPVRMGIVKGTVTLDGEPLTIGNVIFFDPVQGNIANSVSFDPQGGYVLIYGGGPKIPAGSYAVSVTPPEPEAATADSITSQQDGTVVQTSFPKSRQKIPKRYHSGDTSNLKAIIAEGENEFNFELTTSKSP